MTREIVIAAVCVLLTAAVGWIADHPDKVAGTIMLLVAFGILAAVARNRAPTRTRTGKTFLRRKPPARRR